MILIVIQIQSKKGLEYGGVQNWIDLIKNQNVKPKSQHQINQQNQISKKLINVKPDFISVQTHVYVHAYMLMWMSMEHGYA